MGFSVDEKLSFASCGSFVTYAIHMEDRCVNSHDNPKNETQSAGVVFALVVGDREVPAPEEWPGCVQVICI